MSGFGRLLGGGRRAEVFALGSDGARVYKAFAPGTAEDTVAREAAAQSLARERGVAAPAVHGVREIAGRTGIEMDAAPVPVLAEAMLRGEVSLQNGLARMLRLHRAIHARPGDGLPPLHARMAARIARAGLAAAQRDALLSRLAALPAGGQLCHGDFHPFNIMGPPGQEMVIDWADAASGAALADACVSAVVIAPHDAGLARQYLDLYVAEAAADPAEAAEWLPLAAAARLAEGLAEERAVLLRMLDGSAAQAGTLPGLGADPA